MRYGKSFKNITRTLKQLLLEIILFLWSFSKSHVPNEMSRFWWFSGHKIWTQGPIWLILVGNDSPLWDLSYKSVCNNIRQFPKLQEGHKHWFLKGTIIAAIDDTKDLEAIANSFGLTIQLYADDSQLYIAFNPLNTLDEDGKLGRIKQCLLEIKRWMAHNFMKLNEDKTQFLLLGKMLISKISLAS